MSASEGLTGQLLLGKLDVLRLLGGGGMGEVYEVEHRLTGHRRALKVVKPEYAERPRFMKRLMREAKVAGTLGSEYVVETFDAGRLEDGSAYVLMELLEGQNLYEVIQAEGRIEPRRLAKILVQVAEGIAAAHTAGIVHRDLKPENVFLVIEDGQERVKILDFGVSKFEDSEAAPTRLTAEGTLVGTPYYMSPEQAGGREVDPRSDVYALGVMMYEALAGRLPYEASTVGELFVKIGAGQCVPLEARRPDLDPEWSEIAHRAFHRDPEERFPNAEALRRVLLPLAQGGSAARAKTISDGVRQTLDYGGDPLPPPPSVPRDAPTQEAPQKKMVVSTPPPVMAEKEPEPEPAAEEPRDPSEAPPAPEARREGPPAWLWAVGGAAIVLLVLLPLRSWLAAEPTPTPEPEPTEAPTEVVVNDDVVDDVQQEVEETPEPEQPQADLPDAAVAETPTRPTNRRGRTRATAAGLDPNPYRR